MDDQAATARPVRPSVKVDGKIAEVERGDAPSSGAAAHRGWAKIVRFSSTCSGRVFLDMGRTGERRFEVVLDRRCRASTASGVCPLRRSFGREVGEDASRMKSTAFAAALVELVPERHLRGRRGRR